MAGRKIGDETWLEFDYAVGEIERRLGLSKDAAEDRLRGLCRSGDVVSWSWADPHLLEEGDVEGWDEIPQDVWERFDVDCGEDENGITYCVRVSEADFEHCLKQHRASKEPQKKAALGKKPRGRLFCPSDTTPG